MESKTSKQIKRENSIARYVDALFDNHSKINVIRVDYSYKQEVAATKTLEEANKDLNRMMNNRRGKPSIFSDQVGYIITKEYTPKKGVHFHAALMFDGQKVLKDINKANDLGKYWVEDITNNEGLFFNCNQKKEQYENLGIGIISHDDTEKRKNLIDHAISYLGKDDEKQDIAQVKTEGKNERAFIRGTIPKRKKSNIGRPRKK
jgi:hypothetical protein